MHLSRHAPTSLLSCSAADRNNDPKHLFPQQAQFRQYQTLLNILLLLALPLKVNTTIARSTVTITRHNPPRPYGREASMLLCRGKLCCDCGALLQMFARFSLDCAFSYFWEVFCLSAVSRFFVADAASTLHYGMFARMEYPSLVD